MVYFAARRGIPTAIQEQNAFPGLASRWLSRRVRHAYLGLPELRTMLQFGPRTQVFDTGNPVVPPTPERRAASVADYLAGRGVNRARMATLGYGESQLKCAPERSEADYQCNRRVEIRIAPVTQADVNAAQ